MSGSDPLIPNEEPARTRWPKRLEAMVAALAAVPIVLFFVASLGRLRTTFPLEQLEGSMVLGAERIARGLPLYVQPNFTFIPYMYAPAYYYAAAWAMRLLDPGLGSGLGSGFVPLRLLSILSTCGCLALIGALVWRETAGPAKNRLLAAFSAAGLYALSYPLTRVWFDLGRVDSFYILLLLLALYCTRWLHPAVAAAAWTLTFLAKQTIAPVALILLCHDWKRPRRALLGVGTFLLLIATSTRWLDHATHGWFWFYAFTVPRANSDLLARPAVFFVPSQILLPFGISVLVLGFAWFRTVPSAASARARFYLLAGGSLFALCWFLQAHGGATANTPMPLYAILAVLFGLSFGRLNLWLSQESCRQPLRLLLLGAVGIQFLGWIYNPRDVIPHKEMLQEHARLEAWIRSFPGDVFVPAHPDEAVQAGKLWHPDNDSIHDALRPDNPQGRQALLAQIRAAVEQESFDAIALDGPPGETLASQPWLPADLRQHYPIAGLIPGSDVYDSFGPHPVYFLLPCREMSRARQQGWTLLSGPDTPPCDQSPPSKRGSADRWVIRR